MDGDVEMAMAVEKEELTATVARDREPEAGCGEINMIQDDGGTHGKKEFVVNTATLKNSTTASTVEYESWVKNNFKDNEVLAKRVSAHKSETENVEMQEVMDDDEDEDDDDEGYEDSEEEDEYDDSDDEDEDNGEEVMTVTAEDGRVFEMDFNNQPVRTLVDISAKDRVTFGGTRKKAIYRVQLRHYNET